MAIASDTAAKAAELARTLKISFPLLADPQRAAIRAFGIHDAENDISWPAVFVIGADGRVLWRWVAATYKTRPAAAEILQHVPAAPRPPDPQPAAPAAPAAR